MVPQPIALALMLCERVIVEEGTRQVSVISRLQELRVTSFPATASFTAFLVLTNGHGSGQLSLTVTRVEDLHTVYRRAWPIAMPDPLAEARAIMPVKNCTFPAAGRYAVAVAVDGDDVAYCKLRVSPIGGAR